MKIVVSIIAAYLLGSIPFGYIVSRIKFGSDVRSGGSGATGATNVARQFGIGWAILVTFLDIAKAVIAVYLTMVLAPEIEWLYGVAGIVVLIGHIYPVWIGFRGGKGVNSALGAAVFISPWAMAFGLIAFIAAFAISRFVSVGSIAAATVFSLCILVFGAKIGATESGQIIFAVALPILIIWTHRMNIRRLLKGEELRPVKSGKT